MHDHSIHRAMQCPRAGCTAWAMLATPHQIADEAADLWRCDHGHHGPHMVGISPSADIVWSDRPTTR